MDDTAQAISEAPHEDPKSDMVADALTDNDVSEEVKSSDPTHDQKASTPAVIKSSSIPGLPQEDIEKAKENKKKEEKRRKQKDAKKEKKQNITQDQSLIMTPELKLSQEFDFNQRSEESEDDAFEDSVEAQDVLETLLDAPKAFKSSFAKKLDLLETMSSPASTTRLKRGSVIAELSPIEDATTKKIKPLKPPGTKSCLPLRK